MQIDGIESQELEENLTFHLQMLAVFVFVIDSLLMAKNTLFRQPTFLYCLATVAETS